MKEYFPLGDHLILDLFDCTNCSFDEKFLSYVATTINASALKYTEFKFDPQGKTATLLLSESHISIHTYPEHNFIFCDVFTCGDINPLNCIPILKDFFGAKRVNITQLRRGKRNY